VDGLRWDSAQRYLDCHNGLKTPSRCLPALLALSTGLTRGDLPLRISRMELPALLADLLDSFRCQGALPNSFRLPLEAAFCPSSSNVPCLPMGV